MKVIMNPLDNYHVICRGPDPVETLHCLAIQVFHHRHSTLICS